MQTETRPAPRASDPAAILRRRLLRPQRHRLLQGYPMEPLMHRGRAVSPEAPEWLDPRRPLIVGAIPHPFCNPRVEGCGFCTFPHERFARSRAVACTEAVAGEIAALMEAAPAMAGRAVDAVYFGGGTANLTPVDQLEAVGRALREAFVLDGAEVTLEGVPTLFLTAEAARLDWLAGFADDGRISMGVQTFDATWLERMGRRHFGDAECVEAVVREAHARGLSTSADLLVHLPGQGVEAMLRDVERAADLGFDQICVYPLVLFDGIGSVWSKDPELLAARPRNDEAAEAQLRVCERLDELGYTASTLTNFERGPRRFRYEVASFAPERYDAVGFGPGGITALSSDDQSLKWINAARADDYVARVEAEGRAVDRWFDFEPIDLQLLQLTRQLSRGRIDRGAYRARFGRDVFDDHGAVLFAAAAEGLLQIGAQGIRLTPRGCFYADTVQGALAEARVTALRGRAEARRLDVIAPRQPMG